MIKCEGIKAFHGTATVRPKNPKFPTRQVSGDWVYKSEYDCWYCGGSSYSAEIVTDIQEEPYAKDLIQELEMRLDALCNFAVTEENVNEIKAMVSNVRDWLDGVKAGGVE